VLEAVGPSTCVEGALFCRNSFTSSTSFLLHFRALPRAVRAKGSTPATPASPAGGNSSVRRSAASRRTAASSRSATAPAGAPSPSATRVWTGTWAPPAPLRLRPAPLVAQWQGDRIADRPAVPPGRMDAAGRAGQHIPAASPEDHARAGDRPIAHSTRHSVALRQMPEWGLSRTCDVSEHCNSLHGLAAGSGTSSVETQVCRSNHGAAFGATNPGGNGRNRAGISYRESPLMPTGDASMT